MTDFLANNFFLQQNKGRFDARFVVQAGGYDY